MEFKGTTGDWIKSPIMNISGTLVAFIESSEGKGVAQLRGCTTGEELEAEANVTLMTASKDLLEFAMEMVRRYPNSPWITEQGNKAIEKALKV